MAMFGYSDGEEDDAFNPVDEFEERMLGDVPPYFEASVYERIIDHYCEEGLWDKAKKATEWGLCLHPFSMEIKLMAARVWACTGDYQQAMAAIADCESMNPADADVRMAKGNVYMSFGHYQKAIDCYEGIIDLISDRVHALQNIAFAHQCLEDFTKAMRYYQAALTEDETMEDLALEMIHCCVQGNIAEQCAAFFNQQIDKRPYSPYFWLYLGHLHEELGESEKALLAFEYATLADPKHGAGFECMGHSLMNLQRYAEAAEAYEAAVALLGDDASLYCHWGAAKEKSGDYAQAFQHFKKASALDATLDDAWFGMGICLAQKGSWMEATHFFKKATELNRFSDEYYLALANAEHQLGNAQSSEEAFNQASTLNPQNLDVWMQWSLAHYEQGDVKKALQIIVDALEEMPKSAALYYRACAYALYAGDYQSAFQYLETGLHLDEPMHTVLYEFFTDLTMQKAIARIIREIKKGQ